MAAFRAALRLLVVALGLPVAHGHAADQNLERHFKGLDGTFVLLDASTGKRVRIDSERAAERFAPCSTFKIANTAILLETGVAGGANHVLRYDPALGIKNRDWARDHSLASAYRASALWYFLAMARQVGTAAYPPYLGRFDYGNEDVTGALDATPFWVDGSLRISADEQVTFLKRLFEGDFGLSERTTRLIREITVAEETPHWTLRAKTGACRPAHGPVSLWYVGSVERADRRFYFALQMGADTYQPLMGMRIEKARALLSDLGVLDSAP